LLHGFETFVANASVMRHAGSTLHSRERAVSEAIGEVIREGDSALLRKHMKSLSQVSPRDARFTLKLSLSMSCDPLLKQLIRVLMRFECSPAALSDGFNPL
ncbi:hypothetical protein, partial [Caballeronia mineralivorans]|uniref:hypothetical protein n=1 Tax=Caballeronia mineralivorans TaxID=2010198 RepID=UPI002AFF835A